MQRRPLQTAQLYPWNEDSKSGCFSIGRPPGAGGSLTESMRHWNHNDDKTFGIGRPKGPTASGKGSAKGNHSIDYIDEL